MAFSSVCFSHEKRKNSFHKTSCNESSLLERSKQSTSPASSFLNPEYSQRRALIQSEGTERKRKNSQASYRESKTRRMVGRVGRRSVRKPRRARFRFFSSAAEGTREDYRRVVRLRTGHAISLVELPTLANSSLEIIRKSGSETARKFGGRGLVLKTRGMTRRRGRILVCNEARRGGEKRAPASRKIAGTLSCHRISAATKSISRPRCRVQQVFKGGRRSR